MSVTPLCARLRPRHRHRYWRHAADAAVVFVASALVIASAGWLLLMGVRDNE